MKKVKESSGYLVGKYIEGAER